MVFNIIKGMWYWFSFLLLRLCALILSGMAGLLLLVLFPIILVAQGKPLFFRQARLGKGQKVFTVWKFRTMRDVRDSQGRLLPDAERITPLGKWLRKLSLDEIPQVLNIIQGQMHWVGPRPLPPAYAPQFDERQKLRFARKPGITGWAQVHGRNRIPWPERLERDVWYVEHYHPWLDLKIMFRTVFTLIVEVDGAYPSAKFTKTH